MKLHRQLEKMDAGLPAASKRARERELEHQRTVSELARIAEERVEAFAAGDEQAAARLGKERVKAEAAEREAGERLAGAVRAHERARADREAFVVADVDGLILELQPEATRVAKSVEDAVGALVEARQAWHAMEARVSGLLRAAGRQTGEVARLPEQVEEVARGARHAGGVEVPPPLPGGAVNLPIDRVREAA